MTEQNIIIRPSQLKDIPRLANLTTQLGYTTTVEQMTERMNAMAKLDSYWTFVALSGENIVGYIGLSKNYFWEQDGQYLRIQALVVDQKYRALGVGQQLVNAAEELARSNNVQVLLLNCGNRDERQAAHQFYPKLGFEPKSTGYVKRLNDDETNGAK